MANETIDALPLPQQRAYWEQIHNHQDGNTPEYREAVMRIAAIDAALEPQPNLSAAVQTLENLKAELADAELGGLSYYFIRQRVEEALSHLPRQREGG